MEVLKSKEALVPKVNRVRRVKRTATLYPRIGHPRHMGARHDDAGGSSPSRHQGGGSHLATRDIGPGAVLVDPHVAGQAQNTLRQNIAHDLGGSTFNRERTR